MLRRFFIANSSVVIVSGMAVGQGLPQPAYPQPAYPQPGYPQPSYPQPAYPQSAVPGQLPQLPSGNPALPGMPQPAIRANPAAIPQEIKLPQPENKIAINHTDITLKRVYGGWQLWAGQRMLRDFGDRETDARDALRVYKDLRPTEWVTIGSPKPIVEYGLFNGRPPMALPIPGGDDPRGQADARGAGGAFGGPAVVGAGAKVVVPIDFATVRVEAVRGVWCLRDDDNIHFNFGPAKADAEQALAVVQRYGFNRIGVVGEPTAPVMTYFFAGDNAAVAGANPPRDSPLARAALQAQIDGLARVGIPVPGVGFVGEMIPINAQKLDVRKEAGQWLVVSGGEVLGKFGPGEWAARDAARTMADGRFTEFCKLGSAGLTFFLVNGKAPKRVPFNTQGRRFDPGALKVQQHSGKWAVTENGRFLFECVSAEEGDTIVRVIKGFGFDQLCHIGPNSSLGISFLAKGQ